MLVYFDTSAWVKTIADESESTALKQFVVSRLSRGDTPVSTMLLEVEMGRYYQRNGKGFDTLSQDLEAIVLLDFAPETAEAAARLPVTVKALDAIHLASALMLADEAEGDDEWIKEFVTYDEQMARAARELGFEVVSPGAELAA